MEILDICDELGNPTGKTVEREIAHQQGILHRTAHVWILRKKENKIQILLQKRSEQKDFVFLAVIIFQVQDIFLQGITMVNGGKRVERGIRNCCKGK